MSHEYIITDLKVGGHKGTCLWYVGGILDELMVSFLTLTSTSVLIGSMWVPAEHIEGLTAAIEQAIAEQQLTKDEEE
jgi:hypothetical protein